MSAFDRGGLNSTRIEFFEYLGFLSSTLSANSIDFGVLSPGSMSEDEIIGVLNKGNVIMDTLVEGNNLVSDSGEIIVSNMEVSYGEGFNFLEEIGRLLEIDLSPGESALQDLTFRLNVPMNAAQDDYSGNVTIVGVESV